MDQKLIFRPNSTWREAPTAKTPEPVPIRTALRSAKGELLLLCEFTVPVTLPPAPPLSTEFRPPVKRPKLAKLKTVKAANRWLDRKLLTQLDWPAQYRADFLVHRVASAIGWRRSQHLLNPTQTLQIGKCEEVCCGSGLSLVVTADLACSSCWYADVRRVDMRHELRRLSTPTAAIAP